MASNYENFFDDTDETSLDNDFAIYYFYSDLSNLVSKYIFKEDILTLKDEELMRDFQIEWAAFWSKYTPSRHSGKYIDARYFIDEANRRFDVTVRKKRLGVSTNYKMVRDISYTPNGLSYTKITENLSNVGSGGSVKTAYAYKNYIAKGKNRLLTLSIM